MQNARKGLLSKKKASFLQGIIIKKYKRLIEMVNKYEMYNNKKNYDKLTGVFL
jgi:hypothetical protein